MNVLSLFDGMACGLVALKRAGIQVDNYFASEIDKYAIQIAKKNHPEIQHLGDVKNFAQWFEFLPKIDLIIGGSPCQGFSYGGKGGNFYDHRSELFFKYVYCVKLYKPRLFLLENVLMKDEYVKKISRLLGVEPVKIDSCLVSAQTRKRLYWCNWVVTQPEDQKIFLKNIIDPDIDDKYLLSNCYKCSLAKPNLDVFGNRVETKRLDQMQVNYRLDKPTFRNKPVIASVIENDTPSGLSRQRDRLYSIFSKSPCITATTGREIKIDHGEDKYDWRVLTPVECERLQTLPDNYTEGVPENQRYTMLGNGWTVAVIEHIFKCADF